MSRLRSETNELVLRAGQQTGEQTGEWRQSNYSFSSRNGLDPPTSPAQLQLHASLTSFLADSQRGMLNANCIPQLTIPLTVTLSCYNLPPPTSLTPNIECEAAGAPSQSEAFLCLIQCKQSSPDWDFIWPSSALILRFTSLSLSLSLAQSSHSRLDNKADNIKGFHFNCVVMEVIYKSDSNILGKGKLKSDFLG